MSVTVRGRGRLHIVVYRSNQYFSIALYLVFGVTTYYIRGDPFGRYALALLHACNV